MHGLVAGAGESPAGWTAGARAVGHRRRGTMGGPPARGTIRFTRADGAESAMVSIEK